MRRFIFLVFILCCLPLVALAAEDVPGNSCSGVPTNAFRWAGAPENGGVVNGLFCNGTTWTGAINFQSSGNVGIGTTGPAALLDVENNQNSATAIQIGNANTGSSNQSALVLGMNIQNAPYNAGSLLFRGWGVAPSGIINPNQLELNSWIGATNGLLLATLTTAPIKLATNSTEVMRITATGLVGIGTTTPAAALDVAGEIRITGNTLACATGTAGAIRYNSASKAFDYCGGATPAWTAFNSGAATAISSLTAATAANTINNAAYGQTWAWNSLTTGTALTLSSSSATGTLLSVLNTNAASGGGALIVEAGNSSIFTNNGTIEVYTVDLQAQDKGGTIALGGQDGTVPNRNFATITGAKENGISSNYAGYLAFGSRPNGGNTAERMRISSNGYVGIGTISPQAALDVVGDIHYSGALADVSDRRAKRAIAPLPHQLGKLEQLQPVSFIMKNDPTDRTELGLIAQDVEPVFPDLVQTDSTGMKSMNYVGLIAPMIGAMQEQQREIRLLWAGLIVAIGGAFAACFVLWRVRHRLTGL